VIQIRIIIGIISQFIRSPFVHALAAELLDLIGLWLASLAG
jgi:hypothetical protein